MTSVMQGRIELFNFKTFEDKRHNRNGSDKDVTDLHDCFKLCNTDEKAPKVGNNLSSLTAARLTEKLSRIAKSDFTNVRYLLCFFSSHGDGHGILTKDMLYYPLSKIIDHFNDTNCPDLRGIPKVFVIQACRGNEYDDGCDLYGQLDMLNITSQDSEETDLGGIEALTVLSPKLKAIENVRPIINTSLRDLHAMMPNDCIVAFSTPPNRFSWRSRTKGGYYVQAFIKTMHDFKRKGRQMDMTCILLATNEILATNFSSQAKSAPNKRQIGEFVSTLRRKFVL